MENIIIKEGKFNTETLKGTIIWLHDNITNTIIGGTIIQVNETAIDIMNPEESIIVTLTPTAFESAMSLLKLSRPIQDMKYEDSQIAFKEALSDVKKTLIDKLELIKTDNDVKQLSKLAKNVGIKTIQATGKGTASILNSMSRATEVLSKDIINKISIQEITNKEESKEDK